MNDNIKSFFFSNVTYTKSFHEAKNVEKINVF